MFLRSALVGIVLALSGCSVAEPPAREPTFQEFSPGSLPPVVPHTTIHCDTDFTPVERTELRTAAELWRIQTSGAASITLVYDVDFSSTLDIQGHVSRGENIMLRLESWMETVVLEDEDSGASLLGVVSPAGGMHNPWRKPYTVGFVADRLGERFPERASLAQVALHEFGHILGIPHQEAVQGIMFPSAIKAPSVCLRKSDLAAFCSVNECGTYKMSPCE